jgi:apolipoprotein N-acyltransferase
MLRNDFEIMRLNHQYISLIACLLLSSKINLYLSVCLIVLLIMILYILSSVFVFLFCIYTMLISWISIHLHVFSYDIVPLILVIAILI